MMNRVYLLLGSNMGNREQVLSDAVELLIEELMPDYLEVEDLAEAVNTSSVVETEPWGFESSDKFL
ncbi:MAG: 2-amino-4-hydroxy-6-hydroxymethyldihydropteridine diphosphokinase, partial [Bacteroidales bacterium]|nr:2-amino-4-hydroxy-6-hydroxymethyldihydropteridine diphosphokinase [Bacteroidales bacterium]